MSAVPAAFPSGDILSCPQCAQENPSEESYCVACGAALENEALDSLLAPLAAGTVLADYQIETVEPHHYENRYRAVRCDEGDGRVVLRERASEAAESFRALAERTAGITHPALLVRKGISSTLAGHI